MLRPFVALLLAMAIGLQTHLLHSHLTRTVLPPAVETVWLPPAPVMQVLALGYDHVVADVLWLQVIQYYGGKLIAKDQHMPNLWPFFDAITTLDPGFEEAYYFGSYLLADDLGKPDLALTLLDRGRRYFTESAASDAVASSARVSPARVSREAWRYAYQMGFIHFFYRHDKAEASRYFQMAGTVPGAPPICNRLAAALSEEVGERDTARRMWGLVYQTATDTYTRARAERNLARLKGEEDIETLRNALDGFRTQNNRWPTTLDELVQLNWLPSLPVDTNRAAYPYDAQTGAVRAPLIGSH